MTDNLFPDLDEYMEERGAISQRTYELKMLKLLYKVVISPTAFQESAREAREDFDFNWFNDNAGLSIKLFAKKKVVVNPAHVLCTAGFTKTQLWVEYFTFKDRFPKGTAVGMFFPIIRVGQYIIHNAAYLEQEPGFNIMIRQGRSADTQLRVEPAQAFLAALAKRDR